MGATKEELARAAWFIENSDNHTHSVGKRLPNRFGLYDMHGNVWEWCRDWFAPAYYAQAPETDPSGAAYGESRIHRGGGYCDTPLQCRAAYRESTGPARTAQSHKGFRLALVFDKPVATQPRSVDEEVATWVLSHAGRVWTDVTQDEVITSVARLPRTPFKVTRVDASSPYIGNNRSRSRRRDWWCVGNESIVRFVDGEQGCNHCGTSEAC